MVQSNKGRTHAGYTVLEAVICIAITAVLLTLIFVYLHGLTSLATHSAGEYNNETDKGQLTQTLVGDMQSARQTSVSADGSSLTLTSDRWVIQYSVKDRAGSEGGKLLVRQVLRTGETEGEEKEMLRMESGSFEKDELNGVINVSMHVEEGNEYSLALHYRDGA